MNKHLKIILLSIGTAILTYLLVNLLFFGFHLIHHGIGQDWSVGFKHGVFYHNGSPTGFILWSSGANSILIIGFIVSLWSRYSKTQNYQTG